MAKKGKSQLRATLSNWLHNGGKDILFLTLYMLLQTGFYAWYFWHIYTSDEYETSRETYGWSLPMARAAAYCLKLNTIFLFVPVSRSFVSYMRSTFLAKVIPFDHNIAFHQIVAWSVVFWTIIHIIGHGFNIYKITSHGYPLLEILQKGVAITGVIATLALIAIVVTAVEKMRRKNFELFYFTHMLYIVFTASLLVHGSFCFIKENPDPTCKKGPMYWMYWIVPGALIIMERLYREHAGRQKTLIHKVIQYPSNVVEVQMVKQKWTMLPGQYIFICCPEISPYQWHPFSLTSSNREGFFSIHIRIVGDWTSKFAKRLGCDFDGNRIQRKDTTDSEKIRRRKKSVVVTDSESKTQNINVPNILIYGPFGTPSEDIFEYESVILVGGGIGVTPFASILKTIWFCFNSVGFPMKLKKVYFLWVCRDRQAFEWFQDLLQLIESDERIQGMIEINTYLTEKIKEDEMQNILLNEGMNADGKDVITGLSSRTSYGRPNWDEIFEDVSAKNPTTDVGVFLCGPKPLAVALHDACDKWTNESKYETRFFFHKEHF